jgi:dolichyl-phosphate beta-glucosyltransferase
MFFMNVAIIIPAYNEEQRIAKTVRAYVAFFDLIEDLECTLIVVLNGCVDGTKQIVDSFVQADTHVQLLELKEAGKGLAIKAGFLHAIKQNKFDYIGFVDADMATEPCYFYELVEHIALVKDNKNPVDGVIASRYAQGAHIFPPRPFIKRWGSKLVYESLVWLLFGMHYADYQCGAKLFKTKLLKVVVPLLTVKQWAFDVELLYLCKKNGFTVVEWPTVWYDQTGSKLKISSGFAMLWQLIKLRLKHF